MGVIILLKVVQTTIVASTRLDHSMGRILTGVQLSQQTLNICIIFIDFRFGYLTFFTSHFYHMTFECFILIKKVI